MHSCIYEGYVAHRRNRPVAHRFRYRLQMLYLDLDELPHLFSRNIISSNRWSAASFSETDHLALRENVAHCPRERVITVIERATGVRPSGPVRLLTQLRYCGFYFSPLNLYYCWSERGGEIETVLAEVSNTPWQQQHLYVLWQGNQAGRPGRYSHAKEFHVSPFMDMDMQYDWQVAQPGRHLRLRLSNTAGSEATPMFTACMQLRRRELSRAALNDMLIRYPLMTAQVMAGIYFQALKLWWKKCPYYPHPNRQSRPRRQTQAS